MPQNSFLDSKLKLEGGKLTLWGWMILNGFCHPKFGANVQNVISVLYSFPDANFLSVIHGGQ
jgi:hypothetical protein